jgi:hypothetical protein
LGWIRTGFQNQHFFAIADVDARLGDGCWRFKVTDYLGHFTQSAVGYLLANDATLRSNAKQHPTTGAIQHAAERFHRPAKLCRGFLELYSF